MQLRVYRVVGSMDSQLGDVQYVKKTIFVCLLSKKK